MRKIILMTLSACSLMSPLICVGQVPVYSLNTVYQVNISPDTLIRHSLFDLNNDNIQDLVYTTPDEMYFLNTVNGQQLLEPIQLERSIIYDIVRDSAENIRIFVSYLHFWNYHDTLIFQTISFDLDFPDQKDSIFAIVDWHPYAPVGQIVSPNIVDMKIAKFNPGTGIKILIFWSFYVYEPHFGGYGDGSYCVFDSAGTQLVEAIQSGICHGAISYDYNSNQYLSIIAEDITYTYVYVIDSTFNMIDTNVVSDYALGVKLKILKNENNEFNTMMVIDRGNFEFYENPFLEDLIFSHNMPANAVGNFYEYNNTQLLLTGCTNSYFEMRDMEMNLLAFIWGPNITISDADPVDIDQDGTDELLCRTANGFVLYRLDTSTAIDDELVVVPEDFDLKAYPNPFNSRVNLSIHGAGGAPMVISIYNINGQLVRSLLAVNGEATWNAVNDKGQPVSSGLYFASVNSVESAKTVKIVFLK